ncbi:hypothetical protein F4808DRAFT_10670 [Astrocystis sublimbata]|nr:hypothetical protein F4808DRAFT_10670 [Astrocystis sublimbata]
MDQPAAKKRRLAPKVEPQTSPPRQSPAPAPPPAASYAHDSTPSQHYQQQDTEPPPPPERQDFEHFARHLQDAMMLLYSQSQRSPYSKVSALLLRWEDDMTAELDLVALEQVLREHYGFRTDRWVIPATASPSIKMGVRLASFLESAGPEHLLVIHYAGHSYVGTDKQLYWASSTKKGASKLKWKGFRCLLEESQSDTLLLMDSGAVREPMVPGGSSIKQVIAAGTPDHYTREPGARSFTANLTGAFLRLGTGHPFTTEHLFQEAARLRQHELLQSPGLANGVTGKSVTMRDKLPLIYTITSGNGQRSIDLRSSTPAAGPQLQSSGTLTKAGPKTSRADEVIAPSAVADLIFEEPRVLVCTTFVGEASPDMSSFHHWLQNTSGLGGSNAAVEGMFLGPPTMLLISMPQSVWKVVQRDNVCCFLGNVSSHNMTHLYKRLVGSISVNMASAKDMEDGRMLLEAREVATTTPAVRRHSLPQTPIRSDKRARLDPSMTSRSAARSASTIPHPNTAPGTANSRKDDGEDTAEMQEAAEQLKALSHVRHVSDDASPRIQVSPRSRAPDLRMKERTPNVTNASNIDSARYYAEAVTPSTRPKPGRRSIQKPPPKQETRCNHCSHAPFKDSSSLRKHVAAAHTRPFPCAFSFAGCPSTFGSKNEWKRHIASQHLCLQYYRCSSCPQSSIEGKGNLFNRKDLFTQHLRRMHAPFAIKKALAKDDSNQKAEWENHVKEMQQSCLVTRRRPPQSSACPKPHCASKFEGPTSWDEWTEHVGRHMEKGEADGLGVDPLLTKWALDEGIIERKSDGGYRLCNNNGTGSSTERENNQGTEYHSDGNKREPEERTIIAASTIVDKMDVD